MHSRFGKRWRNLTRHRKCSDYSCRYYSRRQILAILSYRATLVLCTSVLDRLIQAVWRVKAELPFTLEVTSAHLKTRIEQAIITFASLFACADADANPSLSVDTPLHQE